MKRKQNFRAIVWLWDLHQRARLYANPPYQTRSVWNQLVMEQKRTVISFKILEFLSHLVSIWGQMKSGRVIYLTADRVPGKLTK